MEKITCKECGAEFEYDQSSDENVITSINESRGFIPKPPKKSDIEKVVTAYLECPNGHIKPYKVTKRY